MVSIIQKFLLIILFAGTFISLSGQSFPVTHYTEEDGLPSSTVYDIEQDSLGRMWFATRNGICRYDGYEWKIFNTQSGLPVNDFIKIKFDGNGNLWALNANPNNYLYVYNGYEWKNFSPPPRAFGKIILKDFDVNIGVDTNIVLSTYQSGIILFKKGEWKQQTDKEGLIDRKINDVLFMNGSIYVSTKKGLSIVDDKTIQNLLKNRNILTVQKNNTELTDKRIWVLTSKELGYLDDEKYKKLTTKFAFRENVDLREGTLVHASESKIIFGTHYTLFIYDKKKETVEYFGAAQGLISEGAYSIFLDREKILWLSGYRGVSKLVSMRLRNYNSYNGLYKSEVTSVVERNKGEYILGHFNGLTIFDGKNFRYIKFSDEPKNAPTINRVHDLAIDKNKNLWIAAEKSGFGLLTTKNQLKWFNVKSEIESNGYSISINSKNEVYGSTRNHLVKLSGNSFKQVELPNEYFSDYKRKIFFDDDDNLYIATSKRGVLVKKADGSFKKIFSRTIENANNVFAVYPLDNKNLLIGTLVGLFVAESDSLKKFVHNDFQIDRPVYFIVKNSSNSFWFGTDNGVTKWNRSETFSLGYVDGLAGLETNRDAGLIDAEGNLLVGTNNGLSIYSADNDYVRHSKPEIILDGVNYQDKFDEFKNNLIIEYEENDLVFHFKAISFINEKGNTYKVKLDGFDNTWLPEFKSDNPHLRYTNLPSGEYRLRIKVKNAAGIWSDEFVSPVLEIEKPFYQQLWFILICIIILISLLFLIFTYIQKIIYSKRLKLDVVKQTSELYETQKRYKSMFEENSTIMLLVDGESLKITDANPSALEFYGFNSDSITEINYSDFEINYNKEKSIELLSQIEQHYRAQHKTKINGIREVEIYPSRFYVNERLVIYIIINDITERILAENIVQESEEKFRGLVENIQDGIFLIQHGNMQYCNLAFASMLGYEVDEVIGKSILDFVSPEYKDLIKEQYKKRQAGEKTNDEYEAVLIHKNGTEKIFVNIHAGLTTLNDEVATIGTIKNITERKEYLEQLTKLSTAVEQSPVCVYITDTEARIEYVNPKFSQLYGYGPDEIIGEYVNILKSGIKVSADYDQLWETIKSGNTWRGELLNKSKAGKEIWVSTSIAPVVHRGGIISHYIAIQDDITFDKYARQAIIENENLLNTVLSKIPLFIFMLDEDGIIKVAKGTVLSELEIEEAALVGKDVAKLKESYKHIEEDVTRAINGEAFTVERTLKNVIAEVTYTPIISDSSDSIGTIGIAYDITERFKFEEELKEAKHEAEKSNSLKSEFLAQMSHEIRTPINSILSFSALIKDHLEGEVNEDLAQSFNFIEAGGRRLIRTIDMILNMSQFQTGTYQPNLDRLDIESQVIKSVLDELSSLAHQKGLKIVYTNVSSHPIIEGDLYTIGQIFVNLVENAIKYSFEGDIKIDVRDEDTDTLIVDIADEGIGMSDDFQKSIFAPFMQEERGYSRKYEGNGLGLALVKKYVNVNNAKISVKSEKGVGSIFSVKFKKYIK